MGFRWIFRLPNPSMDDAITRRRPRELITGRYLSSVATMWMRPSPCAGHTWSCSWLVGWTLKKWGYTLDFLGEILGDTTHTYELFVRKSDTSQFKPTYGHLNGTDIDLRIYHWILGDPILGKKTHGMAFILAWNLQNLIKTTPMLLRNVENPLMINPDKPQCFLGNPQVFSNAKGLWPMGIPHWMMPQVACGGINGLLMMAWDLGIDSHFAAILMWNMRNLNNSKFDLAYLFLMQIWGTCLNPHMARHIIFSIWNHYMLAVDNFGPQPAIYNNIISWRAEYSSSYNSCVLVSGIYIYCIFCVVCIIMYFQQKQVVMFCGRKIMKQTRNALLQAPKDNC